MTRVPNRGPSSIRTPGAVRMYAYLATTQLGWLVCVMTAASHRAARGFAYALIATAGHLLYAYRPSREARLVIAGTVSGWLWDSAVAHSGLLAYPNGVPLPGTAPYWLAGLWVLFAIQLNTLLRWLKHRPPVAMLVGALAGPASFRAGAALGAVNFSDPAAALVVLATGWAVILPTALALARRWDGMTTGPAAASDRHAMHDARSG